MDFPDNGLTMDFSLFDLAQWQKLETLSSRGRRDDAETLKANLVRRAVRLARQYKPQNLMVGPCQEVGLGEELMGVAFELLPRRRGVLM